MLQITDRAVEDKIPPLWRLAFRPGFLFTALFAVASIFIWLVWLETGTTFLSTKELSPHLSPQWWHGHEMLFGFGLPVAAGFLLTAVQNWTGIPGTRDRRLITLFAFWGIARISLLLPISGNLAIALLADALFVLVAMSELFRRVWARKQWHNLGFIPLLLVFGTLNSASYLQAMGILDSITGTKVSSTTLHYSALMLFAFLMSLMGGRVIPFFTARRLNIQQAEKVRWIEITCLALTGLIVVLALSKNIFINTSETSSALGFELLLYATAIMHLIRWLRWSPLKTLKVPLLWSLHMSYLCIPLTLVLLAIYTGNPMATKNIMHLLGIGGMGGMILAMMARVSLGHSGRPLEIHPIIAWAFAATLTAGLIRSLLPTLSPELVLWGYRVSAALWMGGFAVFLVIYFPILTRPRIDGRPG